MSSSLRNAAGNTTGISARQPFAEQRFADLVKAQSDSSQNVTTQTDANNAVVTTYSDNNSAGPNFESTQTANVNTQAVSWKRLKDGTWIAGNDYTALAAARGEIPLLGSSVERSRYY